MKIRDAIIPRKARATRHERWQLFLLGIGCLYEGAVSVLSLGYLTVDVRSWLLFDVFDE